MGTEMKRAEPQTSLADIVEYLAGMSETLAKVASMNGLDVLAHLYEMAALEAKKSLAAGQRGNERHYNQNVG
jgi:hypothetical protein